MENGKSGQGIKKEEAASVFLKELAAALEEAKKADLYRSLRVTREDSGLLSFADNDYLGLARHPKVAEALRLASEKFGVGAGASRLISGTSALHAELEKKIAKFKGTERSLVFGSGYLANLSAVSAIVSEKDLVILDKLDHASIIDAARLSGAAIRVYPHKNLKKLEDILKTSGKYRRRLIVTDSVFSMDGDLAPLPELAALKEKYEALLMTDEAHGTGVFGKNGRGVAEHFGVEDRIDICMGTLSKAVGVMGGFVAGSEVLIDTLINFSRPFIFATALPPALMAACSESFNLIEAQPELREKLWQNVDRIRKELPELGCRIGETVSPILPVLIGDEAKALQISKALMEKGIFVPAIRYPTVARGKARLRLTVSARHTPGDLDRLFTALRGMRKAL